MKKLLTLLLVFAMSFAMVGCGEKKDDVLDIQFVPTNTADADAVTADFEAYMEKLLDMDVKVTVATGYEAIPDAMESGTIDVGIMPPATYVQARNIEGAISILSSTLVDYDKTTEQPIADSKVGDFKAEVITLKDAPISSWKDLEGKTVAILGAASASGFIYPAAEMADAGVDFDKVKFTVISDVVSAIGAVVTGQVDACFTFEGSRFVFNNVVTDNAGNKVNLFDTCKAAILSEGDIPNDAIAVNPSMDDELKAKVKKAFLDMAADPEGLEIMSAWGHTGYVESNEKAYDTIADFMDKAAKVEVK